MNTKTRLAPLSILHTLVAVAGGDGTLLANPAARLDRHLQTAKARVTRPDETEMKAMTRRQAAEVKPPHRTGPAPAIGRPGDAHRRRILGKARRTRRRRQ